MRFDSCYNEKCKERVKNYMDFTIIANQSYMVIMMLRDLQENNNDIINISPAFYQTVFRNCMQALFVDISKMFDNDQKNISIVWLLNSINSNLDLLDNHSVSVNEFQHLGDRSAICVKFNSLKDLVSQYNYSITKCKNEIDSLTTLRNKFYVHLDIKAQNHLDKLFQDNSVSLVAIEKLLTLNTNICNALYMYFVDTTVFPLTVNHDDLYKTISCIEKYDALSKKYNDYL